LLLLTAIVSRTPLSPVTLRTVAVFTFLSVSGMPAVGQELEPGAYLVSPVGVNVVGVTNTLSTGDVAFDPSGPIEDASATINATSLTYGRTVPVVGRYANVLVVVPYVAGQLEGRALGEFQTVRRSGLGDARVRFGINLRGGPAMDLREFARYKQAVVVGVSLTTVAPTGQYHSEKLINLGANRWSFKPEIGVSRISGRWRTESSAGVWLFTNNTNFFGGTVRSQAAIASFQANVLYTFRPRLWAAFNANFYAGGRTTVGGRANLDLQKNSRIGATVAMPLGRRHSLRAAVSRGAYTTIGADFTGLSMSYQYTWGGGL
jgi:hypothetical protein